MTRVLFLNGPPRSGKDTAGTMLTNCIVGSRQMKFAAPLKRAAHAMAYALHGDLTAATLDNVLQEDMFECWKERQLSRFFGATPRDVYKALSELMCKPIFGEDVFGALAAAHIHSDPNCRLWVITDSGFQVEAAPVIHAVGKGNCALVRLHRDGCDFSNDTRSYLDLDIHTMDVQNNGTVNELVLNLVPHIQEWMRG